MAYPAVAGTGYASTIRKPREEAYRSVCIVGALSVEESEAPVRRRMPRPGWGPTCTLRGYPLEPPAQHQRDRAEQLLGHRLPSPLRLSTPMLCCCVVSWAVDTERYRSFSSAKLPKMPL